MKRLQLLLVGLLLVLPLFASVAMAHAQDAASNFTVAQGQTLDKTLYAAGQTVDIAGTINGDVICAGQSVSITGTINGDVICAGQSVSITGKVNGNIRAAGQNVTIAGSISHNLTVAGQNVTLDAAATVTGDATLIGEAVTVDGSIGRDGVVSASQLDLNGSINRNLRANVATLTQGVGAHIGGTLSRQTRSSSSYSFHISSVLWGGFWFAFYFFIALLLIAVLAILVFPGLFQATSEVAINEPLKTVVVGLVGSFLAPLIALALCFTVIGIPLAFFLGLLWIVAMLSAGLCSAYYLGRLLLGKRTTHAVYTMLLGAAALLVLYFIPFFGILVTILACWFGLGMILLQVMRLPRPQHRLARPPAATK